MAFGTVYATGTISVAVGSTSVIGTGVNWTGFEAGLDTLYAGGASALTLSGTTTTLTLAQPWAGPALTNQPYALLANSPKRYDPTLAATKLQDLLDRLASASTIDLISVHGADVASAATINLETATGSLVDITGSVAISAITLGEGHRRKVRFTGSPVLVASANLVLPVATGNIQALPGDTAEIYGYGGSVVRVTEWTRKTGRPLIGRELVTANRTYFIRPGGNDANTGTADNDANAFQTPSGAYASLASLLDFGGKDVTLQCADSLVYPPLNITTAWVGGGNLIVRGNAGTPANTVLVSSPTTASVKWAVPLPGVLRVLDLKTTGTNNIHGLASGSCEFGNVNFAGTGFQILGQAPGVSMKATGPYTISGGAAAHIVSARYNQIDISGVAVTLSGTPGFSTGFVYSGLTGLVLAAGTSFTGSATGSRFFIEPTGVIFVAGAGPNALPGNAPGIGPLANYI